MSVPFEMRNSLLYMTRRCPYSCKCCALHKSDMKEMSVEQWLEVMRILKALRIDFNLIQGNEPWFFKDDLIKIVSSQGIPYAMYTSCHPNIFRPLYKDMFTAGLDNMACGVDSFCPKWKDGFTHTQAKSFYAIDAFRKTRKEFPNVDCQATCTISAFNAHELVMLTNYLCNTLKLTMGVNFIHSDVDGKFDFFPSTKEMTEMGLLLTDRFKFDMVCRYMDDLFLRLHGRKDHRVFGLEDIVNIPMKFGETGVTNTGWHCEGDPYGGPTVDADGSLRLCGYRKGELVPEMTIFDLAKEKNWNEWKRRVKSDAAKCPGCQWNCPRLYKYYKGNPERAKEIFVNHALEGIDGGHGVKRNIEGSRKRRTGRDV